MKHWTALFTDSGGVIHAVAGITELSDGRLNVAVASASGHRLEVGTWTLLEAEEMATAWVRKLLGKQVPRSRWTEVDVTL